MTKKIQQKISKKKIIETFFWKILEFQYKEPPYPPPVNFLLKLNIDIKNILSFLENKPMSSQKRICFVCFFAFLKRSFQYETPCTYLSLVVLKVIVPLVELRELLIPLVTVPPNEYE